MDRIVSITLVNDQLPDVLAGRLGHLRRELARDPALGDVSLVRSDQEPTLRVLLPTDLDEDTAAARIRGAAFTVDISAEEISLTFAAEDRPALPLIMRLHLPGPLDVDARNDEYDRLKLIGTRLGWTFLGGWMSEKGVYADLLVAELAATPRAVGQIIVSLAEAAGASGADVSRLTMQVFTESAPRWPGWDAGLVEQPALPPVDHRVDAEALIEQALDALIADGEAWSFQQRYLQGPICTPQMPGGWLEEHGAGRRFDQGRLGLIRDSDSPGLTIVELETGISIAISSVGAAELLRALQRTP